MEKETITIIKTFFDERIKQIQDYKSALEWEINFIIEETGTELYKKALKKNNDDLEFQNKQIESLKKAYSDFKNSIKNEIK